MKSLTHRARAVALTFVISVAPALGWAPSRAEDPGLPDPAVTPIVAPTPDTSPDPTEPADPAASPGPQVDPGTTPEQTDQVPTDKTSHPKQVAQTPSDPLAIQKALAAAEQAVAAAESTYEEAEADYAAAQEIVTRYERKSRRAARHADSLQTDMGVIAREAYNSSNSELGMLAELMTAEDPQSILAGQSAAARIADHKQQQRLDAMSRDVLAQDAAERAKRLTLSTRKQMRSAKEDLDRASDLAEGVRLAIAPAPSGKAPPTDKTPVEWTFPVNPGSIVSEAGMRLHPILGTVRCHAGADITAASGQPIFAVADGIVISAGMTGGYGNFTVIAMGSGLTTGYAHQSKINVKPGDVVKQGQEIGLVGSTGLSTGPHLHFETRWYGLPYNPRGWLEPHPDLRKAVC